MCTKSISLSGLLLSLLLAGCSVEWKAKVESDTRWSGSFSGRTVDGTGNTTVTLGDDYDEVYCCVVQKQTAQGRLKVTVYRDPSTIFGSDESKSQETTAQYGVVSVCNK